MKWPSLFILTVSSLLFISCNRPEGYKVTAELTGFPDSTQFYLNSSTTEENFDSAIMVHDKVVFQGKLEDPPDFIWMTAVVNKELHYCFFWLENDVVNINGDIKDLPWSIKISGSKIQEEQKDLEKIINPIARLRDSLAQAFFNLSPELQEKQGKEAWARIDKLDSLTRDARITFIKSHTNTYTAVLDLTYYLQYLPKDTIQALYNKLNPEIKASRYAKKIEIFLTEKISEIGDPYHDFEAFDKDGKLVKLSSFTGKYILLDFTSANCGPCVQSAGELRKIHNTYSDSLVIVSFSADPKKEIWLNSLTRDTVTWTSLWDGKGTFSETYIKYGINGIPTFFLIDPKGKIIDKWVGYGKGSLESKLEITNIVI
ncbi:MAG TPA: TlpA disulfide reductase family protein [Bacteroidales bacterium]|nr:TlpA disulfide reductase family protein [Bacteroidales bacterium]